MSEITANPELAQSRDFRLLKYVLQAMILLPVVAGFFAYQVWTASPSASLQATTTISEKILEERFGIRITLIAVTAGGGIVDFRYKIIDKEKAEFVLGGSHTMPTLIVQESGIILAPPSHGMKHNSRLKNGGSHFQFYPNLQNAVKPGTYVSVVIGSLRLEPIIAQ